MKRSENREKIAALPPGGEFFFVLPPGREVESLQQHLSATGGAEAKACGRSKKFKTAQKCINGTYGILVTRVR